MNGGGMDSVEMSMASQKPLKQQPKYREESFSVDGSQHHKPSGLGLTP